MQIVERSTMKLMLVVQYLVVGILHHITLKKVDVFKGMYARLKKETEEFDADRNIL
ncbi:hypothetical protein [Salinicoccus roseus]|uniref:hypothetical protein n=1 Tax=Salinicoccus roseus TaxID=45670 RepID=UPI001584DB51|nr:hypothetical protein [Salinicoccus roseus]MBY8908824.1 hypothetical protein [Salinicoccus roseus]